MERLTPTRLTGLTAGEVLYVADARIQHIYRDTTNNKLGSNANNEVGSILYILCDTSRDDI